MEGYMEENIKEHITENMTCKNCGSQMTFDYDTRDDLLLTEYYVCGNCNHQSRRIWTLTLCTDSE